MPRQKGALLLKGTLYHSTYYKMHGEYFVRKKTSLDGRRVKTDPAFINSRRSSSVFGKAAGIAKDVYYFLPAGKRKHGVIGKLTGLANRLLHAGATESDVRELLLREYSTAD